MLFPSRKVAEMCVDFLCAEESLISSHVFRTVELAPSHVPQRPNSDLSRWLVLYAVIFPAAKFKTAKAFWQHTGLGISSRRAEFHQRFFDGGSLFETSRDKMEAVCEKKRLEANDHAGFSSAQTVAEGDLQIRKDLKLDQSRNAKLAIRERIAQSISSGLESHSGVDVLDVYLYETGMSAILDVHRMLLAVQGHLKSICYGYDSGWPYMSDCYSISCSNFLIPAHL